MPDRKGQIGRRLERLEETDALLELFFSFFVTGQPVEQGALPGQEPPQRQSHLRRGSLQRRSLFFLFQVGNSLVKELDPFPEPAPNIKKKVKALHSLVKLCQFILLDGPAPG